MILESFPLDSGIQVVRVKDWGRTDIQEMTKMKGKSVRLREGFRAYVTIPTEKGKRRVANLAKDNGMDSCEEMNIESFPPVISFVM